MGAITGQRGWERAQKSAEVGHVAPALGADASPERALVPVVDVRQLGCVGRDWNATLMRARINSFYETGKMYVGRRNSRRPPFRFRKVLAYDGCSSL